MRQVAVTEGDKVEAQLRLGVSVNGYGVGDLARAVHEVADAEVDALTPEYEDRVRPRAGVARGRRAARVAARRGADRGGAPLLPRRGRLQGLHRHVRGSRGPAAAAGDRRPEADGGRLRVRRRGRLEDRGARARGEGDGRRDRRRQLVHGGLHVRLRPGRRARARCAHARGVPVDRGRAAVVRDPPALDRRPRRPRAARLHRACRPCRQRRARRPRRPLPAARERGRAWCLRTSRCRSSRSRGRSGGRGRTSRRPPRRGSSPAARITPSSAASSARRSLADFAEIAGIELVVIDAETRMRDFTRELRWNQAYYRLAQGL